MQKAHRYILYLVLGMALYYFIGADENPEVLSEFHGYAPAIILGVVVLLFAARWYREKREKDEH